MTYQSNNAYIIFLIVQLDFWIELHIFIYFHSWDIDKLFSSQTMWLLVLCSRKLRVSLLWLVHSCPQHTHDTHTPCGFLSVWTLCSPSVWFDLIFPLSHLISIPPSLSVRTGKKQGPPENRNKGNPSIHPSVPLCPPSSLLLTLSSPSTQRQEGSVQSISLSLTLRCIKGGRSLALLYLQQGATLNLPSL